MRITQKQAVKAIQGTFERNTGFAPMAKAINIDNISETEVNFHVGNKAFTMPYSVKIEITCNGISTTVDSDDE